MYLLTTNIFQGKKTDSHKKKKKGISKLVVEKHTCWLYLKSCTPEEQWEKTLWHCEKWENLWRLFWAGMCIGEEVRDWERKQPSQLWENKHRKGTVGILLLLPATLCGTNSARIHTNGDWAPRCRFSLGVKAQKLKARGAWGADLQGWSTRISGSSWPFRVCLLRWDGLPTWEVVKKWLPGFLV